MYNRGADLHREPCEQAELVRAAPGAGPVPCSGAKRRGKALDVVSAGNAELRRLWGRVRYERRPKVRSQTTCYGIMEYGL